MASPNATACSGRGAAVTLASGQTLCSCVWTWSAGADLFELRPYPSEYPDLQSDCLVPTPGLIVIWTLLLALLVLRFRDLAVALHRRLKEQAAKSAAAAAATRVSKRPQLAKRPVQLMLVDALIATPLCVAATCYKLSDLHGVVLGTDVAFTVTLMCSVAIHATIWAVFQHLQFRVLAASQHLLATSRMFSFASSSQPGTRMLRAHFLLELGLCFTYILFTIVPTFTALGLNPAPGPVASGEYITLIVRNMGVVLWVSLALAAYMVLYRQVRSMELRSATEDSDGKAEERDAASNGRIVSLRGGGGGGGGGGGVAPANKPAPASPAVGTQHVLAFLGKNVRSNAFRQSFALVTYTLFSIPPAWPYTSFNVAFGIIIVQVSMSPAKVMNAALSAASSAASSAKAASPGGRAGAANSTVTTSPMASKS